MSSSETSFLTAAYLILRKDGSLLISLLAMMLSTGMPELQAEADLEYMRTQLQLDQSSEEQVLKFLSFIFLYFWAKISKSGKRRKSFFCNNFFRIVQKLIL